MTIDRKKIGILSLSILCITSVYAIDTLIENIQGSQFSIGVTPFISQNTRTINDGDLRFMNKNNDTISIGDYFSGYYYDAAFGVFEISNSIGGGVFIDAPVSGECPISTHDGYSLSGFSYNPEFGFMSFNESPTSYVFICIARDPTISGIYSYLGGEAYSRYVGFQNFDDIRVDDSVDIFGNHEADGRFVRVDGNTTSTTNDEIIANQFTDDIRILGKLTKSNFRQDIQTNVYNFIKYITPPSSGTLTVSSLGLPQWSLGSMRASLIKNDEILYFSPNSGDVIITAEDNLVGTKTLVVEGANIYITGNIRGDGIFGIIALEVNGVGGNIYIDPSVTDIHAVMYADKSIISYDGNELDGSTANSELANQLYIYGSIFSENTIGGSLSDTCPFYVNSGCTTNIAKKYDLNYLRRYILVQPVDASGNSVGSKEPQFNALESYMGDNDNTNTVSQKPGYEVYPLIIEYNPKIQSNPPPLF